MQEKANICLFPLGVVLLPSMVMPLHIFEERYKLMINDCLEENKEFGIVYYSGENFSKVGCQAKIIEVIKKYPDGRMDIFIEGKNRFTIESTSNDKPYMTADVSYFDDEFETEGDFLETSKSKGLILLEEIMKVYTEDIDIDFVKTLTPKVLSFLIISNSGFNLNEKQSFLEMVNTRERLEKAVKALEKISLRLKSTYDIQKIIQSNGYLGNKKNSYKEKK